MRIALLADIHGNVAALEAVLAALDHDRPDYIVSLGDTATVGPDPAAVLDRLQAVRCLAVLGNTDADLIDPPRWYGDPEAPELPESARRVFGISRWCRDQLQPRHFEYLRTFRPTLELPLPEGGRLLAFHGSPRRATDVVTATTAESDLDEMFAGSTAIVFAGGHTHVPMLRRHRSALLVNPGSVGLPFAHYGLMGQVPLLREAQYAVLSSNEGDLTVKFARIPIDVSMVTKAARDRNMPFADWWSQLWQP